MLIILGTWEAEIRRIEVQSQPRQIVHETLFQKYPTQKRAGGVVQVIQCLPSQASGPEFKTPVLPN
jgi:hypothetical protein